MLNGGRRGLLEARAQRGAAAPGAGRNGADGRARCAGTEEGTGSVLTAAAWGRKEVPGRQGPRASHLGLWVGCLEVHSAAHATHAGGNGALILGCLHWWVGGRRDNQPQSPS